MIHLTQLNLGVLSLISTVLATCGTPTCDLPTLQETALQWDQFITTGDLSTITNLSHNLTYLENDQPANIHQGFAAVGLTISANRTFYDTARCKFFSEHVITDPANPYVIATQAYISNNILETLDVLVTQPGDLFFNATEYQTNAYAQTWDEIPEENRNQRETLQAISDAYFEHLHDRSFFPAATPCWIVIGGWHSGRNNESADTCTHEAINPARPVQTMRERRYVVDEVGLVWGFRFIGRRG